MRAEWEKECLEGIVRDQRDTNQFVWSAGMGEKLELKEKFEMPRMLNTQLESCRGS